MDKNREIEILLVEDNATDAELIIRTFRKNNLDNNIVWVKDGAEALDFMFAKGKYRDRDKNTLPKVVLLDLRLPKVDGLEVLRVLKNDERTKCVPVVVLTSSKDDRDIVESYKLGVNSFVSKPVEFDSFVEVITDLGFYWLIMNRIAGDNS